MAGVRLRGRTLSWRHQPAAAGYALAITAPDGVRTSHSPIRPRLRLPFRPRRGRFSVTIVALSAQDKVGPSATERFRIRPNKRRR